MRLLEPTTPRYPAGLFGGSFNPPTLSHVTVMGQALDYVESMWVVPSLRHPFKGSDLGLPYEDRLALMSALAAELPPGRVQVSNLEKRMAGVGYTYDVLHRLMAEETGGQPPAVVMGEDLLGELPRWFRYADLLREFPFVVLPDTGLHATLVRQRLLSGEAVNDLVPAVVSAYLKKNGLQVANG